MAEMYGEHCLDSKVAGRYLTPKVGRHGLGIVWTTSACQKDLPYDCELLGCGDEL